MSIRYQQKPYQAKSTYNLYKEGASAGLTPLTARTLNARGITRWEEVWGSLSQLLHHSTLKGTAEAAQFLLHCIETKKHIVVVADYDCDGATACTVAVRGLRAMGAQVDYVVPDRFKHGYGLTAPVVDVALEAYPTLKVLLTVDNGVASHDGIDYAVSRGVEVLVTDHHMPSKTKPLPAAVVVVDHQQEGCTFASKALAGVGVIWYVLWALQDAMRQKGMNLGAFRVSSLLPLVAVGSVADVVPLDFNNRILIQAGLEKIRRYEACCGILALAQAGKVKPIKPENLTTTDIAFAVGPRINAAGRLKTMEMGINCLLEDDMAKAQAMADELDAVNQERKNIEYKIVAQAVEQAQPLIEEGKKTIVVCGPEWNHGVIGIVAGRIKEKRMRPTFVLTEEHDGLIKGSGRSIPGFNLKDALDHVEKAHPGLLPKFGGHAMAAGVTIRPGGLETFKTAFEVEAQRLLTDEMLQQIVEHDGSLSGAELTTSTVEALDLIPWGQLFTAPAFCDEFEVLSAAIKGVHKDQLVMKVRRDGVELKAVKFRYDGPVPSGTVQLVYKPTQDFDKYGNSSVLLMVDHIVHPIARETSAFMPGR